MASLVAAPDLVLLRISAYLQPEDIAHLAQTCRRLYAILPHFLIIRGPDFHIRGPHPGHWAPEPYFDGPPLPARVRRLQMSVVWKDQGWGNRKGEIYVVLKRGSGEEVATKRQPLGIAPHEKGKAMTELWGDPVVTLAREGDHYHFVRNAGGGGGHQLKVKNFRVVVELR